MVRFATTASARVGADRCFLVRRSRSHLTCCLVYDKTRVEVTDILHERVGADWQMRVGVYHKLRLSIASLTKDLEAAGLAAAHTDEAAGWLTIVASPASR